MLNKPFFLSILFLLVFISCSKDSTDSNSLTTSNKEIEAKLFTLVNQHRESIGLIPLEQSKIAQQYAKEHTLYMVTTEDFSHTNFQERAKAISAKTNANYIAENIANNYDTAEQVMLNWLQSSDHKANLEGEYTHTGISVMHKQDGNYYFTELFYK
nr:CAP domain-containing protein [Cellulophaga sp. 20_2_10]